MDAIGKFFLTRPSWLFALVATALIALPIAIWLDLRNLSDQNMRRQATSLNNIISSVRSYYAQNVVGRILASDGNTQLLHNYGEVSGAIPIPATLSIELGDAIGSSEGAVKYRFVSDFPFKSRPQHRLDEFETMALASFRSNPENDVLVQNSGKLWNQKITLATPVVMSGSCVSCHNGHVESAKSDWEVGDVRGIQTVSVNQPIALNIWTFKWLLGYLGVAGTIGALFSIMQYRLAGKFSLVNEELAANNEFLADISVKISKYLSPQVYKSIFSGEKDASISTERKKLTVFFSDIKDFTATTEQLQPEELTELLNNYFTEMAQIAEAHGATVDKFIGDAIVAFFGDPETKGTAEDARACVRMALDMQHRLQELEQTWHEKGLEHPFRARMGINTGYCNVGNFGSADRMDYTIIGAEANLAARLESIADPGGIVLSFETYAHVKDIVNATPLESVAFKGIAREVVPYVIVPENSAPRVNAIQETPDGNQLTVDLKILDEKTRRKLRDVLQTLVHDANATKKQ
ncbi:Adenylate cyclase 1 [Roseovarius albus]|uniref:Adenylate cyclase 1 n=1 Tax=Roseovarius albus TaxID=1247867 RepID=A0A1X7A6I5_9RHOB|nr:adenylate/guanylate cyclase domain-containing protein [Roseovarius albus]SLN71786.1 Adenylate cyclase 1 [Roseovarius albus]